MNISKYVQPEAGEPSAARSRWPCGVDCNMQICLVPDIRACGVRGHQASGVCGHRKADRIPDSKLPPVRYMHSRTSGTCVCVHSSSGEISMLPVVLLLATEVTHEVLFAVGLLLTAHRSWITASESYIDWGYTTDYRYPY